MSDNNHKEKDPPAKLLPFGQYLKEERERQGLSIEEIARRTGIKQDNLIALENSERRKLPADVFNRGFIKLYAEALKIDSEEALSSYAKEWGFSNGMQGTEIFFGDDSMAEPSSVFENKQFLVFIFIVILVASVFFAYKLFSPDLESIIPSSGQDKTEKSSQASYLVEPSTAVTEPKTQDRSDNVTDAINNKTEKALSPIPTTAAEEEKNIPERHRYPGVTSGSSDSIQDISPNTQAPTSQPETTSSIQPPADSPLKIEAPPEEQVTKQINVQKKIKKALILPVSENTGKDSPTEAPYTLNAFFKEMTWLRIKIDQKAPQEYTFRAQEKYTWKASESISMFIGNAGGLQLYLNDEPIEINKKSGQTLKFEIP